jgi:hypothetical protein
MPLELLSTIFAGLTFAVIAATAIAAIVQLRHLRASNQITATIGLMDKWAAPEFRTMANFVHQGELERKLLDPAYRAELSSAPIDKLAHPEVAYLDFWESVGSLIKLGHISEEAYLDLNSYPIVSSWRKLEPVIAIIRRKRGPQVYDMFEYLASRAMLWEAKHPYGTYPTNTPHLPVVDKFPADAGAQAHVS